MPGQRPRRRDSGPALTELVTDSHVLALPPHVTGGLAMGFALAGSKVGLGKVGCMLSPARANLRCARPSGLLWTSSVRGAEKKAGLFWRPSTSLCAHR